MDKFIYRLKLEEFHPSCSNSQVRRERKGLQQEIRDEKKEDSDRLLSLSSEGR
jgi:hypothetical protein